MKREKLLKTWFKLFSKYWFKHVSIDELVKDAGMAKGTFYLYFKNKDELYGEIVELIHSKAMMMIEWIKEYTHTPKERLVLLLLWSLVFFERFKIIKQICLGNKVYLSDSISFDFLKDKHHQVVEEKLEFSTLSSSFKKHINFEEFEKIKNMYGLILHMKDDFESEDEFYTFAARMADIFADWMQLWSHNQVNYPLIREIKSQVDKVYKNLFV